MKEIRASSLGTFRACPFKYRYHPYDFDSTNTYFWTILHTAARWYDVWPLLDYYFENFEPNIASRAKLKKCIELAKKDYEDSKDNIIATEIEVLKQKWDYLVKWTPDRISIEDWIVYIDDIKTSKYHKYYDWDDIWEESMQPIIYSYMIMLVYDLSEVVFRYKVFDKTSPKMVCYQREIKREYAEEVLDKFLEELAIAEKTSVYEAKICTACKYCALKNTICPQFNEDNWAF